jgi:ferredoxin
VPKVVFHKLGETHAGEVRENTNLVVRAGIKQFPFPHLRYGCGMGKCSKCACEVIAGGEHLPPPNWKEKKLLRDNLDRGYRLICQLWISQDIELRQDSDEVWAATIKPPEEPAAGATGTTGTMKAAQ